MKMIKQNLFLNLRNVTGWHTNRRIVVIESDDWGSIRMPSLSSFEKLKRSGLDLVSYDAERYNLNDSLATSSDLEMLFGVLSGVRDKNGASPVFTAVSVVANPDFERIRNAEFEEYFYEPFTETLKRYPGCERSFDLWKEGIKNKLFVPQMHGREHLSVNSWMRALKNGEKQTHLAFNEGLWGFVPDQDLLPGIDYQAAFLLDNPNEIEYHASVIIEGLQLFERIFGYRAEYFVPPNGPFNNKLNTVLVDNGIKFRSAARIQNEPQGNRKSRKIIHWMGQKDKSGLKYITRNCFFEPTTPGKDWINSCLNEVKVAFLWQKPAVISSHRVNYIGALNRSNRDKGLRQLDTLLRKITKTWDDVEFMTTIDLGNII